LGRAFQVHDDIMGIWGATAQTGKSAAGDIRSGKKTLPIIEAWERGNTRQRAALRRYFSGAGGSVQDVLSILSELDTREAAAARGRTFKREALDHLDAAGIRPEWSGQFASLAAEITGQL
jgi:geranylgeranyl diphosphate synthase type I